MRCPRCHDEYHDDVSTCVDCGVELVSDDTPLSPRADAHLGRFHPIVAARILPLLVTRGIAFETDPTELPASLAPPPTMTTTLDAPGAYVPRDRSLGSGDEPDAEQVTEDAATAELTEVTIRVEREFRDDLRSELTVNWSDMLARLPSDAMYAVLGSGGPQPGWFDGPRGAWIDRDGRLQVEVDDDETRAAEAERILGPSMAIIGAVLAIFGYWQGGSGKEAIIIVGVGLLASGLFLPR